MTRYGEAMPRPTAAKIRYATTGGLRKQIAEHRAEERPAARRGEDRGEHALGKRAFGPFLDLQFADPPAADKAGDGDLPHTQETQGHHKDQRGHGHLEPGERELFAPGQARAGRQRRQHEKDREDARRIPSVQSEDTPAAFARLIEEGENLQADDRQHARHEVQNQSAQEGEAELHEQRAEDDGLLGGRCIIAEFLRLGRGLLYGDAGDRAARSRRGSRPRRHRRTTASGLCP